jgi:hypothetical protein
MVRIDTGYVEVNDCNSYIAELAKLKSHRYCSIARKDYVVKYTTEAIDSEEVSGKRNQLIELIQKNICEGDTAVIKIIYDTDIVAILVNRHGIKTIDLDDMIEDALMEGEPN